MFSYVCDEDERDPGKKNNNNKEEKRGDKNKQTATETKLQ